MAIRELLEDELKTPSIGTTDCFSWHATSVGIAALWTAGQAPTPPPHDNAPKEGLPGGLALGRGGPGIFPGIPGLVLVFHS